MEIIDVEEEYVVSDDGTGSWQPVTKQRAAAAPTTKKQKTKQAPSTSSGPAEIEEF